MTFDPSGCAAANSAEFVAAQPATNARRPGAFERAENAGRGVPSVLARSAARGANGHSSWQCRDAGTAAQRGRQGVSTRKVSAVMEELRRLRGHFVAGQPRRAAARRRIDAVTRAAAGGDGPVDGTAPQHQRKHGRAAAAVLSPRNRLRTDQSPGGGPRGETTRANVPDDASMIKPPPKSSPSDCIAIDSWHRRLSS